jgi:hypothetical protein
MGVSVNMSVCYKLDLFFNFLYALQGILLAVQ